MSKDNTFKGDRGMKNTRIRDSRGYDSNIIARYDRIKQRLTDKYRIHLFTCKGSTLIEHVVVKTNGPHLRLSGKWTDFSTKLLLSTKVSASRLIAKTSEQSCINVAGYNNATKLCILLYTFIFLLLLCQSKQNAANTH